MTRQTHLAATIASACLVLPSTGLAAENPATSTAPVIVTATRTAQTANETVAPVTTISREDIRDSGATTLPDLLAGRPGIDLSSNGGPGKATTINLRGLGNGKIVFLINGSRISDPSSTDGAPAIQHIPVAQIERVEIVRGPRSTLYGSNALGGVINIITRNPKENQVDASVGYGSYNTRRGRAGISGGDNQFNYNLSLAGVDSDGFDIRDDSFDDKDGYDNTSVSGRVNYSPTNRLDFKLDVLSDEGTTEYDNCFDQSNFLAPASGDCTTDFQQNTVGIETQYQATKNLDSGLRISHSRQERRNFYRGHFNNEFDTSTTIVSWQNDIQIGTATLVTLGIDGTHDSVDKPADFERDERDRAALYGQWQTHSGAHDIVVGVRGIDDEQFGTQTVGNIDYGYELFDDLRLLASAGTAFKAPTLYQLYSPLYGNDDLEAEESTSIEFGIAGTPGWGHWSARVYRNEVRNLIDFVGGGYANVADKTQVDGFELEIGGRIKGWNTNVSYSASDAVNEKTDKPLPNRAERTFRLAMKKSFGYLTAGGSVEAQSERSGGAFSDPVAGYGILNLHASYRFNRQWQVRGTVENVFDNNYQTNDDYFAPGRTAFVYLEYRSGGEG